MVSFDELRVDLPVWWEASGELVFDEDEVLVEPIEGAEELGAIALHLDVLFVEPRLCRVADGLDDFGAVVLDDSGVGLHRLESGCKLLVLLLDQSYGDGLLVPRTLDLCDLCNLDCDPRVACPGYGNEVARQIEVVLVKGLNERGESLKVSLQGSSRLWRCGLGLQDGLVAECFEFRDVEVDDEQICSWSHGLAPLVVEQLLQPVNLVVHRSKLVHYVERLHKLSMNP